MKNWLLAVGALWVGLGCSTPTDLQPSVAIVHGTVNSELGQSIEGARVQVFLSPLEICEFPDHETPDGTALSGTDGRYSIRVQYLHVAEGVLCGFVVGTPPAGSELRGDTASAVEITVRHESRVPPMDSVQVNLVFKEASLAGGLGKEVWRGASGAAGGGSER